MNQARKKRAWKIFEAMLKKREEVGNTILNLAWDGVPEDLRCRWNDVTRFRTMGNLFNRIIEIERKIDRMKEQK